MDPHVPPYKLISRGGQKFNRGGPKKISARFARHFQCYKEICPPPGFLDLSGLERTVLKNSFCGIHKSTLAMIRKYKRSTTHPRASH